MHVLVVCSGNTCRSPMAAALLSELLSMQGPPSVRISSAGTGALNGAPASEGAYLVALEAGIDLSSHRSRTLTPELVDNADLILTMSHSHLARVEQLGGAAKAAMLSTYATQAEDDAEIPDPFGGDLETYRDTFHHLAGLMAKVRDRLQAEDRHD